MFPSVSPPLNAFIETSNRARIVDMPKWPDPALQRRSRDQTSVTACELNQKWNSLVYAPSVRYLVTGAAGFIGSNLAEALAARGDEVVALDDFSDYYDPARKRSNCAGFDVQAVDLAVDPLDFTELDGVFHLAGQPGVRSFGSAFPLYLRRNVLATQRVLEAASGASVRVVFASSSSVYGDAEAFPTRETAALRPRSPYGITKLACEHLAYAYAESFGVETVALRYFTVYGPRQRPDMFMQRVVEALFFDRTFEIYGDGKQARSFTFVADAVAATIAAMEATSPGVVYNVGGGEEATVEESIRLLETIAGRVLDIRRGPPAVGDVRRTSADTSQILCDLHWRPQVALEHGLLAQWAWALQALPAS
jgi:UDP-glucuronate 4-epimerase